jgi:hypothetical protein
MKKKILGIFVCMLLIITVLPATGTLNEKAIISNGSAESTKIINESIPILNFMNINGDILKISAILHNSGESTAYNINWSMYITEGSFFIWNTTLYLPKSKTGSIDVLEPGENETISITPIFGLGTATVTFFYNYTLMLNRSRSEVPIDGKKEGRDQAWLILHTFPEPQPTEEWKLIEYPEYVDDEAVILTYVEPPDPGITQLHYVHCINTNTFSEEYVDLCKFTNGVGRLKENWFTKENVEDGFWEWEVLLIDGV